MPFQTMYDSGFYRIEADPAQNLLMATWLRPVQEKEVIEGGTNLYRVLRDTKVERAVGNAQVFTTLSPGAKEWMSSSFYRLLSDTPLQKLARVLPHNLFHQIALESVATRAEALGITRFKVKNFSSPEEALAWVLAD